MSDFLGEERDKYIDMIVNLEKKLWIPMCVEPRSHWEAMTDDELFMNLKKLQDVENNPV